MSLSLQKLLASIVDYAGLFPPAAVTMEEAVENYTYYRLNAFSWMLGRFLLPISQWDAFEAILQRKTSQTQFASNPSSWPVHIIVPRDYDLNYLQVELQRLAKEQNGYEIKAVELPVLSPERLNQAIAFIPKTLEVFCEIPLNTEIDAYLAAIKTVGRCAKVRAGGLTPDSFSSAPQLADFIIRAARMQLPFKATAGLHHLFPGKYSLSSLESQPQIKMQGFLNVAIAAAIAYCFSVTQEQLVTLLEETSSQTFRFIADGLEVWEAKHTEMLLYKLSLKELIDYRTSFFYGFGSCSFDVPTTELQEAKLC